MHKIDDLRRHIKKIITILLVCLIFNGNICYAATEFSLEEALYYGQTKSFFKGDLRKSMMSVSEKQKAITGAYSGGSLSMSLDFMKIFEDGPPYQKLFGNVTKGPTAVYNYNLAVKQQPFKIRDTEYKITTAYFDVYKANLDVERALQRYKEAEEKYNKGKVLLANGEITQESLNDQKKKVDSTLKSYNTAKTAYDNKITKLNDLVYLKNKLKYSDYTELKNYISKYNIPGQNTDSLFRSNNYIGFKQLNNSYKYSYNLKRARVGSDVLPSLVNAAISNNWEVAAMDEQRIIDEYYIYACLDLYKKEFGSSNVYSLEQLIKSGLYTIDDLDFTLKYDKFVSYLIGRYGEGWSPYYNIKILFLKFKIPKLFKYDEYDGVRYLEDSRYELQQRVMQFLQLLMDIDAQKKTVTELTTNLFLDINNLDSQYEDLNKQFDSLKTDYDLNQIKYKSGDIKADVLISQKDELDELDDKIHSTLIDMNEKILQLNYMTNGLYEKYTVNFDGKLPQTEGSPFTAPNMDEMLEKIDKLNEKKYSIDYMIDSAAVNDTKVSTADLSIKIEGEGFDCDQYQIVTADGVEISDRLGINDKFRHFEFTFSNLALLKIKFYKDGNEICTGEFEGYGVLGKVNIK